MATALNQSVGRGVHGVTSNLAGGTPLHMGTHLYNRLSPAPLAPTNAAPGRADHQVSRESSIAESRRQLLAVKIAAWEREADTLEVSVSKVRDCPSVLGVKLLRDKKE